MKAKLNTYRREGAMALRHMFYVIIVFSIVQFIVSIIVANKNNISRQYGGYRSIGFSAIWTFFLVLFFAVLGGRIVFGGKAPELLVGFLIGVASMLSQLFFVLAVLTFGVGTEATTYGYQTAAADKAYGAFALVNTIIYFVWAVILSVHRKAVTSNEKETAYETAADNQTEVYNPTQTQHDEAEL